MCHLVCHLVCHLALISESSGLSQKKFTMIFSTFTVLTKLLVATRGGNKSVEVINLDESSSNFTCENLPDHPLELIYATGQLFQMIPLICGGYSGNENCFCNGLENGKWHQVTRLPSCDFGSWGMASTLFPMKNKANNQVEEVLVLTGGRTNEGESHNIVKVFNGNIWNLDIIPRIPNSVYHHCLVAIDDSHLVLIGGMTYNVHDESCAHNDYTRKVYVFDVIKNKWISGPNLNECRARHSCGVMKMLNQNTGEVEKVVVVAGGDNQDQHHNTTELLFWNNLDQGWVMGPSLPYGIAGSSMVEYQDGVILIGGDDVLQFDAKSNLLFQLSSPFGTWFQMRQTLKVPRSYHVSFLVPDELVVCN